MNIFNRIKNVFRKSKSWEDLTTEQKIGFTKNVIKTVNALSGARYKIVEGTDRCNVLNVISKDH